MNTKNEYELLNLYFEFKNNGLIRKVLKNGDYEIFKDKERTRIPCLENDYFIISDIIEHTKTKEKIEFCTLIKIDYNKDKKYKNIFECDSLSAKNNGYKNPLDMIENYIKINAAENIEKYDLWHIKEFSGFDKK